MYESSEFNVGRDRDRVGEGCIKYRSDYIGHGLLTLQPQTILYVPSSHLVYKGAPLPQQSPGGEGRPQNLH